MAARLGEAHAPTLPPVEAGSPGGSSGEIRTQGDGGSEIQVSDVQISSTPGECIYPRTPPLGLGLISVVSLMLAQYKHSRWLHLL